MNGLFAYEVLTVELLLIATITAIVVRRLRIPYTVALVAVGAELATQTTAGVSLPPGVILLVLLPSLLFEVAFHLRLPESDRGVLDWALLAILRGAALRPW